MVLGLVLFLTDLFALRQQLEPVLPMEEHVMTAKA